MIKRIATPLSAADVKSLKAGDKVLISGIIYTARDQAHKKMLKNLKSLPIDIKGAVIYYTGPTPPRPGAVIGSIGPTTSYRMDTFTPALIQKGLLGMIGKGKRGREVVEAVKKYKAVYFVAGGGLGALLAQKVKKARVIAFKELGAEAVQELEVEDFPVIVGIDSSGKSIVR